MKGAYPVIIDKETFVVDIPDFNIKTEGRISRVVLKWQEKQSVCRAYH